jgi:hypothetical protein
LIDIDAETTCILLPENNATRDSPEGKPLWWRLGVNLSHLAAPILMTKLDGSGSLVVGRHVRVGFSAP